MGSFIQGCRKGGGKSSESVQCARALRRCYFIGGGAPVDLGRRRRRAVRAGAPTAFNRRRRGRKTSAAAAFSNKLLELATTNNKQYTIRLSSILYCGITFKRKQTTNESYYYCSQHFRLNFVGPISIYKSSYLVRLTGTRDWSKPPSVNWQRAATKAATDRRRQTVYITAPSSLFKRHLIRGAHVGRGTAML